MILFDFNRLTLFLTFCGLMIVGCSNSEDVSIKEEESETSITEEESTNTVKDKEPQGEVSFFNSDLVYDGYILVSGATSNRVYLMDKESNLLFDWPLNNTNLGKDATLLPSGKLLAMLEDNNAQIKFGGFGGKIQLLDKEGNIEWEFIYSTQDYVLHHDAEMLPNGNILIQTWERKTVAQASEAGSNMNIELFPDGIIEVNPATNEIVWEWHAWDHLIQDFDTTKNNYGSIAQNPHRIDINYTQLEDGDMTHANGLTYDKEKDLIYLSVNFFSEIWVIDHSTTTTEAATSQGGNYNFGGNLIYRFGNPEAYKNTTGTRRFFNNHHPNLDFQNNSKSIFVFSNGQDLEQSTVYELEIPSVFSLLPNEDNEPKEIWSFTDSDLYSPKVSGAVPLPNGNVLITEGDFGLWEVTRAGEVVWKFNKPGFYWRGYHFDKDSPEIKALNL
ncbi:MAG: aryl-sulfate sulfotransferase [Eudoraea sp.]|uniref:aryl-sulfate sulfotransferase n=1 Tax=Eudoraea sp. TaxID=1979955 RepID=UPI003C768A68